MMAVGCPCSFWASAKRASNKASADPKGRVSVKRLPEAMTGKCMGEGSEFGPQLRASDYRIQRLPHLAAKALE